MPLPSSGSISAAQIKSEFIERYPNNPFDINNYRGLGYPPPKIPSSGPIRFSDFYGKSYRQNIFITFTSSTNNVNIYNYASPYFTSGIPATIIVTINPGVVIGSNSTGSYAMTIPSGSYPSDGVTNTGVRIYNYGYIVGAGGNGGSGNCGDGGGASGSNGGNAILCQFSTTIYNYGVIAGGGGGGGGGGGDYDSCGKNGCCRTLCGGGGGGGAGSISGSGGYGGQGNSGGSGSLTSGGSGGGSGGADGCGSAGGGGSGGGLGQYGSSGGQGCGSNQGCSGGGSGAAPGYYLVGVSNVGFAYSGDLRGLQA